MEKSPTPVNEVQTWADFPNHFTYPRAASKLHTQKEELVKHQYFTEGERQ